MPASFGEIAFGSTRVTLVALCLAGTGSGDSALALPDLREGLISKGALVKLSVLWALGTVIERCGKGVPHIPQYR